MILLFLIIKVFRLHGRPYSDSIVSYYYYYYYFSVHRILCTRFLEDYWVDFHEIYRIYVLLSEVIFSERFFENSHLVPSYGTFSEFKMTFCLRLISRTVEDINVKLSGIIDRDIYYPGRDLSFVVVTSCR